MVVGPLDLMDPARRLKKLIEGLRVLGSRVWTFRDVWVVFCFQVFVNNVLLS